MKNAEIKELKKDGKHLDGSHRPFTVSAIYVGGKKVLEFTEWVPEIVIQEVFHAINESLMMESDT